jgi:hypothetical protein
VRCFSSYRVGPAGGSSHACHPPVSRTIHPLKILYLKKRYEKQTPRSVAGAPEIAYPNDDAKWELQTAFFTAFLFEMWERVEARDEKASLEARAELQTFLINSLGQSLRLVPGEKDSTPSEWACKLLADIFVSIGKHVGKVRIKKPYGKLMEIEAFKDEKKRIGKVRKNLLFPGMVCAITQRELKKAGHFRKRLLLLSAIDNRNTPETERQRLGLLKDWEEVAKKEGIPEAYWPLLKLPEFSKKHLVKWWEFLWPIIQTYLPKDSWYQRPPGYGPRKRYFGDLKTTASGHLKTLARLRDEGAFYLF